MSTVMFRIDICCPLVVNEQKCNEGREILQNIEFIEMPHCTGEHKLGLAEQFFKNLLQKYEQIQQIIFTLLK